MGKVFRYIVIVFYGVKALTELLFWLSSLYINIKIWEAFSKSREVRHFKKVLKSSRMPKDLRKVLISEYSKELSEIYSQLSLLSMIKGLIKSRKQLFLI